MTTAAAQSAVVSARVDDPDGIGAVTLYYRVDPSTNAVASTMRDDGAGGYEGGRARGAAQHGSVAAHAGTPDEIAFDQHQLRLQWLQL